MEKILKWLSFATLIISVMPSVSFAPLESSAQNRSSDQSTFSESFALPKFQLETYSGQILTDWDLAHAPTLLTFVLPDCFACENAVSMISSLVAREPGIQYVFATKSRTPELLEYFENEMSLQFPILIDSDLSLAHLFAVDKAPLAFLIQDGVVLRRIDWPFTWRGLLDLFASLQAGSPETPSPAGIRVGQRAPEFSAPTTGGKSVSLTERSTPMLIVFYSELCPLSMRFWMALSDAQVALTNLQILGISSSTVTEFDQEFDIVEDVNLEIFDLYGIHGTPTSILLDEDGTMTLVHLGFRSNFVEAIQTLLNES